MRFPMTAMSAITRDSGDPWTHLWPKTAGH